MLANQIPDEVRDARAACARVQLVDVREAADHASALTARATLIPIRTLPQQLEAFPRDREIILHCRHGMLREMVGNFLLAQGFARRSHVVVGIDRWSDGIAGTISRY